MLAELLAHIRVLPVLTVETPELAVALTSALVRGGAAGVEITLRTPAALAAIDAVRRAHPDLPVGAGSVRTPDDLDAVKRLGVTFAVSPGMTRTLIGYARGCGIALLPGVATASEAMLGAELGLDCFKLFPARVLSGLELLKAFAAPLAGIGFCPTGGIDADTYLDYLAAPNVLCAGGSWMAPAPLVAAGEWDRISETMAQTMSAASLGRTEHSRGQQ
jgi:2-dehydro-3-deoxyphosphogluconate aldolase/(4S)-4-hydroxy-2-oxoglutarate aldolase